MYNEFNSIILYPRLSWNTYFGDEENVKSIGRDERTNNTFTSGEERRNKKIQSCSWPGNATWIALSCTCGIGCSAEFCSVAEWWVQEEHSNSSCLFNTRERLMWVACMVRHCTASDYCRPQQLTHCNLAGTNYLAPQSNMAPCLSKERCVWSRHSRGTDSGQWSMWTAVTETLRTTSCSRGASRFNKRDSANQVMAL